MITVGIVHHATVTAPPFESDDRVRVATILNAGQRPYTGWCGFGQNHNVLMRQASGSDWYVAVNPDVAISRQAVIDLVAFAEAGGYVIAGPAIRTATTVTDRPAYGYPTPRSWLSQAAIGTSRTERLAMRRGAAAAWVTGACMAIRLAAREARFDEAYFLYFEDVDFCLRARRGGGQVGLCADIVVEHDTGWAASSDLCQRKGVEFARSAALFARRQGASRHAMRAAGLVRFGSRIPFQGRDEAGRVSALSVARGFLRPEAPGIRELARAHNALALAADQTPRLSVRPRQETEPVLDHHVVD